MIGSLLLALQGSVVLVVLDDVGREDFLEVQADGYTPNIDYLQSCGVTYANAYANPICSPSRHSLLFGEFYTRTPTSGCSAPNGSEPALSLVSIAEESTSAGLHPFLVGKWHLGSNPNYPPWQTAAQAQGFETWRAGTIANLFQNCASNNYSGWSRVDDGVATFTTAYNPIVQRDQALSDLASTSEPVLLVLSLNLAHGPFHAPDASLLPSGYPTPTTEREKYEAMIAAADSIIGSIIAAIDIDEDSIIIVGDNGTPIQVAPDPTRAKTTTYERGIAVPLIVAGPVGQLAGTTDMRLAHVADVYATIQDFFGSPSAIDGLSLFGVPRHASVVVGHEGASDYDRSARGPRFKFRRFTDVSGTSEFLYDLLLDPNENTNQVGNALYAAQEAALRSTLDAFEAR